MTSKPQKSIFFQSLGCPKNLVDTEVMLGISKQNHYQIVAEPGDAEVIVVNTCSFINDSKQESIDTVLELAQYKEAGSCKRLIVTGCLPQRYKADLKVSFPEVDAFVGTGQYQNILQFIEGRYEDDADFKSPRYIHLENTPRINSQPAHRAYLKLSEGCMKNCAFCIIPKIRGRLRSRGISSLVTEATQLAQSGVVELNLIAQDLTDYGRDLKDGSNLNQLLRALVKVDGIRWIRLFYVYPDVLSGELLDTIASEEKICAYIDTPIQHINDRMLALMNRKVTGDQIRERIATLRKKIPNVSIRSGIIVGYPGETQEEYEQLKNFIQEYPFDHLGVFAYSLEENTASYTLPDHLPEEVKQARRDELMAIQQRISKDRLERFVDTDLEILVEGPSEESEFLWKGRHQGQAPDIDGHVLLHSGIYKPGEILSVRIEHSMEYDLVGSPTDPARHALHAGFERSVPIERPTC